MPDSQKSEIDLILSTLDSFRTLFQSRFNPGSTKEMVL